MLVQGGTQISKCYVIKQVSFKFQKHYRVKNIVIENTLQPLTIILLSSCCLHNYVHRRQTQLSVNDVHLFNATPIGAFAHCHCS